MDLVVEKATELGVHRIAPFLCRHAVGQGVRTERWRRIAVAAAKQSGRTPGARRSTRPCRFAALVRAPWPGLRLLAWEGERERPLAALPAAADAAIVVVGPEGGFAADEVADARAARLHHGVARARACCGPRPPPSSPSALCQHRWGDLA